MAPVRLGNKCALCKIFVVLEPLDYKYRRLYKAEKSHLSVKSIAQLSLHRLMPDLLKANAMSSGIRYTKIHCVDGNTVGCDTLV